MRTGNILNNAHYSSMVYDHKIITLSPLVLCSSVYPSWPLLPVPLHPLFLHPTASSTTAIHTYTIISLPYSWQYHLIISLIVICLHRVQQYIESASVLTSYIWSSYYIVQWCVIYCTFLLRWDLLQLLSSCVLTCPACGDNIHCDPIYKTHN